MEASGFVGLWGLTSAFAIVFSHFSSEVYRSKGNPRISLFTQLLHLACIIPTLLISIQYDFKVLYTARSLVRIQLILTAIIIMRVLYKFKISDVIKNVLPMILSSIVMGGVGFILKQISPNILWQFVSIMLCAVIYFVILLVCFPKTREEVLQIPYVQKVLRKIKKQSENK